MTNNPIRSLPPGSSEAPRCGAKTRSGSACQSRAMANGRCRMHGGTSPGAPKGNQNARKHGARSAEIARLSKLLRGLARDASY
ncbi:HGGxSTG domain-containing protein [Sphingopyxis alaskensis]|uniref:HGGxSTG domain-containing protein n=1 Tax=Sphingopyxis alaskensis TaxID=117207 RepID=UPI003D816E90